jgi:hypothetical protein
VLLNLGVMTTLANKRPANLTVIVFDNQCYIATGGLPTATAGVTDLAAIANGAGIQNSCSLTALDEFEREARATLGRKRPNYIVDKVEAVGKRMSTDMYGKEGKYCFVRYIERTEGIKIIGTAAK